MIVSLSVVFDPVGEYATETMTHGRCDARPSQPQHPEAGTRFPSR